MNNRKVINNSCYNSYLLFLCSPKEKKQKERAFAAVEKNPVHNARQLAERRYPLRSHRSAPLPCYGRRIFFITPQVCDMTLTTREIQRLQQWQDATLSSEVPPCNLLFSFLCFVSFFFSGRRKKERNEGKNFYYHTNHLGSTAFVTDQNQTVTQGFLYAPFGEITTEYAPLWQNGTLPKYAFNAKELDEETGMYYYEARYYKPPVFTSRDAMFEKYFWMTPYAYCANNPVKYVDPSGEEPDIFMFALTEEKYNIFLNGSKHIKERSDAFQVMAHGNPQWMREVKNGEKVVGNNGMINSAEKFNEVFKNNEKWNNGKNTKGFSVILYSCNTGKGKESLAHKLSAKYQNITVIAPSSKVWFSSNGLLGTYNSTKDGKRDENNPGYWLVYQKGKVVSAYDATWVPGESTEGHQVDISKIPQDHLNGVLIGEKEMGKGDDK